MLTALRHQPAAVEAGGEMAEECLLSPARRESMVVCAGVARYLE